MKINGRDPLPSPFQLALTLSGKRVHAYVPVRFSELTLCREVIYEKVTPGDVQGRTVCAMCMDAMSRLGNRPVQVPPRAASRDRSTGE